MKVVGSEPTNSDCFVGSSAKYTQNTEGGKSKCRPFMGSRQRHCLTFVCLQEERSRAISFIFSGLQVGSLAGLLVAPPLIEHFGWEVVFYIFGVTGASAEPISSIGRQTDGSLRTIRIST